MTAAPALAPERRARVRQAPAPPPVAPDRAGLVVVCAALAIALVPLLGIIEDPDLWWHLRDGAWILDHRDVPHHELYSYTAAGNGLTAHEWGFEVLATLLDRLGGLVAVGLVGCVAAWSGLVAVALRARDRGAPALAIAATVLLGAKALEPVSGARPQMLGFALLCWLLLVVERYLARGGRGVWLLPPLVALWANLHGGFLYGLALAAAIWAIEAVRARLGVADAVSVERRRRLLAATGLSALAACCTPNGPGLYVYAVTTARVESGKPIAEWASPDFHNPYAYGILALLVLWPLLAMMVPRPPLRDALLGTAALASMLLAVRNVELGAAVALPPLAVMLGRLPAALPPRLRPRPLRLGTVHLVALAAVAALAVGVGVRRLAVDASPASVAARYPECAATLLAALPGDVRIHAAYADGGFLIDRGWPHLTVYDYGESISLGDAVLADDLRIESGTDALPSALSLLDRSGTTAVLTGRGGPLDGRLGAAGTWRLAAVDHDRSLWLRGAPDGAAPVVC